jgi:hypothetical protein
VSMVSAGSHRGWRTGREHHQAALEVVLMDRTYLLPWTQFLYAAGGDNEVRLVFATHDIVARGNGLGALLTDAAAQRVVGIDEPGRAEAFGNRCEHCVRQLIVRKVEL